MEGMLKVYEAANFLADAEIPHSQQMIRRWLRQGKIKGERSTNRKEGWLIPAKELFDSIYAQQWIGTAYEDGIDENTMMQRFREEIEELHHVISELGKENYELRVKLGLEDELPF